MAKSAQKQTRRASAKPTATAEDDRRQVQQPTTHTRLDPINTAAENRMVEEEQQRSEEEEQRLVEEQEEKAKRDQELFQMRQDLMVGIIKSPEGYVVGGEDNSEAIEEARKEGLVYQSNVQSGPGGLEVEERWFLSQKGYDALRTSLGPNMGK